MVFVIGVTGTIASGKETLAQMLALGLGAKKFGFSEVLDEELTRLGKPLSRPNQRELASEMRMKQGPGVWARRLVERISKEQGYAVVEGFRNPLEVKEFYSSFGKNFMLVSIDAKFSVRFKRAKQRAKEGEKKTEKEFKDTDERERGKEEPFYGHNIDGCMALADYKIINEGTLNGLKTQANLIMEKARKL